MLLRHVLGPIIVGLECITVCSTTAYLVFSVHVGRADGAGVNSSVSCCAPLHWECYAVGIFLCRAADGKSS
jgi:hypothetical protein